MTRRSATRFRQLPHRTSFASQVAFAARTTLGLTNRQAPSLALCARHRLQVDAIRGTGIADKDLSCSGGRERHSIVSLANAVGCGGIVSLGERVAGRDGAGPDGAAEALPRRIVRLSRGSLIARR